MQRNFVKTPEEINKVMKEYGLDKARYRKFLESSVLYHRETFDAVAPMLPEDQRLEFELTILQGELGLEILRRAG